MVGRKREQSILEMCLASPDPELLAVYGRQGVGKTYLITNFFHNQFAFHATGVAQGKTKNQLRAFHERLRTYGCTYEKQPKDWFEAFSRVRELMENPHVHRDPVSGKRVVFLDEMPWMDTAKSDFRSALEYFWNSWGSVQTDLLLIACGSAVPWMMKHLLSDTGCLYRRGTRQMDMAPFTLRECETLFAHNQFDAPRKMQLECYMIFGGIPFYLNQLDRRMSLKQNVEALCFHEEGSLRNEYQMLLQSLFRKPEKHRLILEKLALHRNGLTRAELAGDGRIGTGEALTDALNELEQCGMIRKFSSITSEKQGHSFRIIDPFTLFSCRFLQGSSVSSWRDHFQTPGYCAWCGDAFATVCLHHIPQIKQVLGISGVGSREYSWRDKRNKSEAQIDLLIDRQDQVINLCDMVFTQEPFIVSEEYSCQLMHTLELFRKEAHTEKAIHLTLISAEGISRNSYVEEIQNTITMDDLFT